jgi:ribosomal protein S18 acetylase RimI-like enzyme
MKDDYQIRPTKTADIPRLVDIYHSWENNPFINIEQEPSDYFSMCINKGDLPPLEGASKDNYQLYSIFFQDQLIGYFDCYHGYPRKDYLWISIFVIDQTLSGYGHGSEVVKMIESMFLSESYPTLALGVKTKNTLGLKFWTKVGFREILGVYGEEEIVIALKKTVYVKG